MQTIIVHGRQVQRRVRRPGKGHPGEKGAVLVVRGDVLDDEPEASLQEEDIESGREMGCA